MNPRRIRSRRRARIIGVRRAVRREAEIGLIDARGLRLAGGVPHRDSAGVAFASARGTLLDEIAQDGQLRPSAMGCTQRERERRENRESVGASVEAHWASSRAQGVTASVTVLVEEAMTPAADVAESVYVIVRFDEKFLLVMFVTTDWGVVVSVTGPVLVSPGGATTEIVIVTPAGIAALIDAMSCFVVPLATFTRYVAVDVETPVGALPAT